MKKLISVLSITTTLAVIAGCAGNEDLIKTMSTSISRDIFQEVPQNTPPAPGYLDLRIYSSLKTHKPGIYSETDPHGTPKYKMLVNIDGQAIHLEARLTEEKSGAISMRDPNEGIGIRYRFEKKLRIKAGAHKIIVAIPADDLAIEGEILLSDSANSLIVEPVYGVLPGKKRLGLYGATSFKQGVKRLRLTLNGKDI